MAIKQTPELNKMLQVAADLVASDIHLTAGEPVSYRVNGNLNRSDGDPMTADQIRAIAAAAVGEAELDRIGLKVGDIRTSCGVPGVIDAKLSVARAMGDLTVVIRVMPSAIMTMEECGTPPAVVEAAEHPHGLIIISGRMGSGKTTVAVSLLNHLISKQPCQIATVEDPIASFLTPKEGQIHQREVGVDVPDILSGIRASLEQDPDVIMVSEMTRIEEVNAALTAASMGHMVIVVMNVGTAVEALEHLINIHPTETQVAFRKILARELCAVSAQCLLVRADRRGRVAAYDVLIPDDNLREAIVTGKSLRDVPRSEGSVTLKDHLAGLQKNGVISTETVHDALTQA